MKPQDAKRYLAQYRESMERAGEIVSNLSELKREAEALRDHEGQRVQLDAAVAKYVDACKESEDELDRLAEIRTQIMTLIDKVGDTKQHSVLWRRYISGMTWEQVAVSMSYTYRRITQLHGAALRTICEIMPKT